MSRKTKILTVLLVFISTFIFSLSVGFGEYLIVDQDGNVLSEDAKKVVKVSPGEKVERAGREKLDRDLSGNAALK